MNIKEMREKSNEELKIALLELYKVQFKLRMKKGALQSDSAVNISHLIKKARRDIARIKTLLVEEKKR